MWSDAVALDRFLADHPIARRWEGSGEAWHVRLRRLGGHGTWHGFDVGEGLEAGRADGAVAVLTRADVRLRSWRAFAKMSRVVDESAQRANGLLDVVGIRDAPIGRLGTFSLWRSLHDARAFAAHNSVHHDMVLRTRSEGWFTEELFCRFQPYASTGTWDGRDPLAPSQPR